jgi:hypothetical protein
LIAAMIDCMADMPDGAGMRDRAGSTKAAKAKNAPAIRPEPSTARMVAISSRWSIMGTPFRQ